VSGAPILGRTHPSNDEWQVVGVHLGALWESSNDKLFLLDPPMEAEGGAKRLKLQHATDDAATEDAAAADAGSSVAVSAAPAAAAASSSASSAASPSPSAADAAASSSRGYVAVGGDPDSGSVSRKSSTDDEDLEERKRSRARWLLKDTVEHKAVLAYFRSTAAITQALVSRTHTHTHRQRAGGGCAAQHDTMIAHKNSTVCCTLQAYLELDATNEGAPRSRIDALYSL